MSGIQEQATDRAPALLRPEDRTFVRNRLRDLAGIEIGDDRDSLLASRLSPVVRQHGLEGLDALVSKMRAGEPGLQDDVVMAMTTNETSFFRDAEVFADLASSILPELLDQIPAGEPLIIWSAACSSGQEAYSLAMLLDQYFPQVVQARRVRILATDISPDMVERTRSGQYSKLEVRRGLPEKMLNRYFEATGNTYTVTENLRSMVLSRPLNLIESLEPLPSCQLVMLRNVLIYFSPEVKATVLTAIRSSVLAPYGALVLGALEMLGDAQSHYESHDLNNISYYTPRPVSVVA